MSTLADLHPDCLDKSGRVESVIVPRTADIGGFEVHRALPSRTGRMVGPFIFWDQMGPGEFLTGTGLDVRPHPHIGLATLTYLFDGGIMHRDSLGTTLEISPGAVNLMTAGSGITHSERTSSSMRTHPHNLFGIQSWIALPRDKEEMAPDFAHVAQEDLPFIDDEGVRMRLIAGEFKGLKSPTPTYSDTLYADLHLKAGAKISIPATTEERALYPLSGELLIGGVTYAPNQLLILHPNEIVDVKAVSDTRFMLMGGEVMDGQRYIFWNFVSSRKDRLEQAKSDWQNGRFAKVPGDDLEFIPLP